MDRQLSRTEIFEAHQQDILNLRNQAIDSKTMARAYKDLAAKIKEFPSQGDLWDVAREDVVRKAMKLSTRCEQLCVEYSATADERERRGI